MKANRPGVIVAAVMTAALITACADEPSSPSKARARTDEAQESLGLDAEERARLAATFLFAGEQSTLALQQQDGADRVAAAFAAAAGRVEADDRAGTERALAAAREAVRQYRELSAGRGATAADLEGIGLTLERATEVAASARAARRYATDREPPTSPTSREER